MNNLVLYFILANIGLAAFYLFFRLFLHKDTFFREKRVALLMGMFFALAYPMVDVSGWLERSEKVVLLAKNMRGNLPNVQIESNVVGKPLAAASSLSENRETKAAGSTSSSSLANAAAPLAFSRVRVLIFAFTWFDWALLLYVLVATVLLVRIALQLIAMLRWMRLSERFEWKGVRLYRLPKGIAPFSFFKAVFLDPEAYCKSDLEEILQHEQAHGKQGHTYDVLFGELLCVGCWANPFAWLLKRRIRENLEFLADQDVLHKGFDPKTYQYHLLQLSCQRSDANLANHFNVSQLKKRIVMMNKKRTSWAGLGKYALSLPLFAALLLTAYAWGQQSEAKVKTLIGNATAKSKLTPTLTSLATEKNAVAQKATTLDAQMKEAVALPTDSTIQTKKKEVHKLTAEDFDGVGILPISRFSRREEQEKLYKDYKPKINPDYFILGSLRHPIVSVDDRFFNKIVESGFDAYTENDADKKNAIIQYIKLKYNCEVSEKSNNKSLTELHSTELTTKINELFVDGSTSTFGLKEGLFKHNKDMYSFLAGLYFRGGQALGGHVYQLKIPWYVKDTEMFRILRLVGCESINLKKTESAPTLDYSFTFEAPVQLEKVLLFKVV